MTCSHDSFAAFGIEIDSSDMLKALLDNGLSKKLEKYYEELLLILAKEWEKYKEEWKLYDEKVKVRNEKEIKKKCDCDCASKYMSPIRPPHKVRSDTYEEFVDNEHISIMCALDKHLFYDSDGCFNAYDVPIDDMEDFDLLIHDQEHEEHYYIVPKNVDVGCEIDPNTLKEVLPLFQKYFGQNPTLHCAMTGCGCCS